MQILALRVAAVIGAMGLAPLPALAAPPPAPPLLDVYGDLPGVEDISVSPTGKLALAGRLEGERVIVVLDHDRKIQGKATLGDSKLRYLDWAGDDFLVIGTSVTSSLGNLFVAAKYEVNRAIVLPLGKGKIDSVFSGSRSIAPFVIGNYGTRQIDGKWSIWFGGLTRQFSSITNDYYFEHGRPTLFRVELGENSAHTAANPAAEDHERDWLIDGRGQPGAIFDIDTRSGKWSILNARNDTVASGVNPTGGIRLVAFNRDGSGVIYARRDAAAAETHWFEVPLAGGAQREVFAGVTIRRSFVDPANGRMLGYETDVDGARPVLFDPAQDALLQKVYRAFSKLDVEVRQWTPDFSYMLVRTSGNGNSGTWYLIDMKKLKADEVGRERPEIDPQQVGPISTVAYKAGDGLDLDGVLTLPPGREAKNLPVVMLPHGGPNAHDKPAFYWWAQAFASRGYAVFQPNFRGSTNRNTAFRLAGNGEWGRKMQTDISDGLTALAAKGIVDPKRACIAGASYGGYAALAGVTLQKGIYRCAVAVAPVSDLTEMYQTDLMESGENPLVRRRLVEQLGDAKKFAEVSPRRHAAQADAPVLLMHGKDDTVVAFRQSAAMADALKSAGKPVEMVDLRDEDHWLSRAATRKQMLEAAVAFVGKHKPAQ